MFHLQKIKQLIVKVFQEIVGHAQISQVGWIQVPVHCETFLFSWVDPSSFSYNLVMCSEVYLGIRKAYTGGAISSDLYRLSCLDICFQTLGTPLFNRNPNYGCPKRIYQHNGQAHKHFSRRFHGVPFLADVQTWRSKQKFVFIATNLWNKCFSAIK